MILTWIAHPQFLVVCIIALSSRSFSHAQWVVVVVAAACGDDGVGGGGGGEGWCGGEELGSVTARNGIQIVTSISTANPVS